MSESAVDTERIAQNKLKLNYSNHSVSELLLDCLNMFSGIAELKGLTFTTGNTETECIYIKCDYDLVLQVLSNLIDNALKFTPQGGNIKLNVVIESSVVKFEVVDNGPGIADAARAQIFEQFSQLKSTDRSGLALGLYISNWLVKAHGEAIQITSQVGKGSTFSFSLPICLPNLN